MKIGRIIKGIISYLFAMMFAVIFGLFLNANVGWFILLTLILAPTISVFFAWLSSRMLSVSCEMGDALLSKGDTYSMTVNVQNMSIFPTPPITVLLTNDAGVRSENRNLLVSVMPKSTQNFVVDFKAKICGKSTVGIESVRVTDYLGLFSFRMKKADCATLQRTVAVIPDIAEISARDDNLVKAMQTSLHVDDSEDTVETAVTYSFSGFPGYENREYVPGDPLKRINWKQSAKRNKLLVRLDEEMASKSINVVLDSVFNTREVDIYKPGILRQYRGYAEDEIIPKIAEDAVENALGITQVLVRHNYTVNFYVMQEREFVRFEIVDESDLETVRLELAHYSFFERDIVDRIPKEDQAFQERVGLFSTPNSYEEAYTALEGETDVIYTNIYSVQEEVLKLNQEDSAVFLQNDEVRPAEKQSVSEKIFSGVRAFLIPYLLSFLLSVTVFSVFNVPLVSFWTLAQMLFCAGIILFCEYVNRHRVIGTFLTTIIIVGLLNVFMRIVFRSRDLAYMHWFMSGGDSVETTSEYLMSLLLVFTVFFSMTVYYFVKVRYKTSYLLVISLIPFVVYVKIMKDIPMVAVVLVTVLNIATFLLNIRAERDKGKRIEGYANGLVSLGLYTALLVLIGLAVPEAETKYYYLFESAFMGGNVSEVLPEQYSEMSEYSGNADGFNELNNRKLYVINGVDSGTDLYLRRQTFDFYDFDHDRWYPSDYYSETVYTQEEWAKEKNGSNLALLLQAIQRAESYEPGILGKYGLKEVPTGYGDTGKRLQVETTNFASVAYITPPNSVKVTVRRSENADQENTNISRTGIFQREGGFLDNNIIYDVEYYDEDSLRERWLAAGGANFDFETSGQMLEQLQTVLETNGEAEYAENVAFYLAELDEALLYQEACEENTELIPESVRELAAEITKDCTYDWEKAAALQAYFRNNDFVYDLNYEAPDDSVEYFLFEGKTGTCSDYASAYVLMARSVGLIVRYVEGFVPQEDYATGDYLVRTSNGHAYPEVFISNVGFVVYEATIPARYGATGGAQRGMMAYFMSAGFRAFLIFAMVSTVIVAILFIHMIAAPYVREIYFLGKVKKALPGQAVIMLYKRMIQRHSKKVIENAGTLTPYEYAKIFEETVGYDISELIYLLEKAVFAQKTLVMTDKERAREIYLGAKKAIKEQQKGGRR